MWVRRSRRSIFATEARRYIRYNQLEHDRSIYSYSEKGPRDRESISKYSSQYDSDRLEYINRLDDLAHSALLYAITTSSVNRLDAILCMGADLNRRDRVGSSPLINLCYLGYRKIIEILVEYSADISTEVPFINSTLFAFCKLLVGPIKLPIVVWPVNAVHILPVDSPINRTALPLDINLFSACLGHTKPRMILPGPGAPDTPSNLQHENIS